MILIVGGGNLSSYLYRFFDTTGIPCDIASRSIPSKEEYRVGPDLLGLGEIVIPRQTRLVVITWSYTDVRNERELLRCLQGAAELVRFIESNSWANFLYFSSSVAQAEFIGTSFYAASKYLLECMISRCRSSRLIIVRPGLIYGLPKCSIQTLFSLWRKGLPLIPGRLNVSFSVTSAESIARLITSFLDERSWLELKGQRVVNYCEDNSFSLGEAYEIFSSQGMRKTKLLSDPIVIGKSNIFYRVIRALRLTNIDLSLAGVDRAIKCDKCFIRLTQTSSIQAYSRQVTSGLGE